MSVSMPRPKKQPVEAIVEPAIVEPVQEEQAQTPFYSGMPAVIVHTHEDGYLDLTVSYDGKTQVVKGRVSPQSIEYKKAS